MLFLHDAHALLSAIFHCHLHLFSVCSKFGHPQAWIQGDDVLWRYHCCNRTLDLCICRKHIRGSIVSGFYDGYYLAFLMSSMYWQYMYHRDISDYHNFKYTGFKLILWFLGLGSGLAYMSAVGVICEYFFRYRPLAQAIAMSGAGIGNILFPWITSSLMRNFGWRGKQILKVLFELGEVGNIGMYPESEAQSFFLHRYTFTMQRQRVHSLSLW